MFQVVQSLQAMNLKMDRRMGGLESEIQNLTSKMSSFCNNGQRSPIEGHGDFSMSLSTPTPMSCSCQSPNFKDDILSIMKENMLNLQLKVTEKFDNFVLDNWSKIEDITKATLDNMGKNLTPKVEDLAESLKRTNSSVEIIAEDMKEKHEVQFQIVEKLDHIVKENLSKIDDASAAALKNIERVMTSRLDTFATSLGQNNTTLQSLADELREKKESDKLLRLKVSKLLKCSVYSNIQVKQELTSLNDTAEISTSEINENVKKQAQQVTQDISQCVSQSQRATVEELTNTVTQSTQCLRYDLTDEMIATVSQSHDNLKGRID